MEHVSVLVCKSDKEAKRMAYSQHSWIEQRDCTLPKDDPRGCPRNPHSGNFVTYAGLEGHGNYPSVAPLHVYDVLMGKNKGIPISIDNLGGVFIGDRTLVDPYRRWEPAPDGSNVIPVPPLSMIQVRYNSESLYTLFCFYS